MSFVSDIAVFVLKRHVKLQTTNQPAVSCANMDELIKTSFGMWTRVGSRKHVLGGEQLSTLSAPVEYNWTIHVRRRCSLISNYFNHLLKMKMVRYTQWTSCLQCFDTVGRQEGHPACKRMGGWWRWAPVSPDWVAPSRMVGVSAFVNLPRSSLLALAHLGGHGKRTVKRLWWCIHSEP